jgi:nitrogen regulatory protein PII
MKLVMCVIRQDKHAEVVKELQSIVPGLSVREVRGYGHQKGHSIFYRGAEYEVNLLPKTMIEIVSDDNKVDDVVQTVIKIAGTGNIGDGRIFVFPVEDSYHIRSGFMDRD